MAGQEKVNAESTKAVFGKAVLAELVIVLVIVIAAGLLTAWFGIS